MDAIAELFIANGIKSAILACVVALIALVPWVRNLPNLQHSLWGVVLIAMITPPLLDIPMIPGNLSLIQSDLNSQPSSNLNTVPSEVEAIGVPLKNVKASEQSVVPRNGILIGFTILSLVGTVCILFLSMRRGLLIRRAIRLANFGDERLLSIASQAADLLGVRRRVRVAVIQANTSPFIWIDRDSVHIVLSETIKDSLSDERLLCVMLHELSHYRRRDHWANTIGFSILAFCWWNPVSWIAVRKMRALQEYCCDAVAIAKSRTSRREYAEFLYRITDLIESHNTGLPASACELFGHTAVEKRFVMIANPRICFETTKVSLLVSCLFAAFLPCTIAYSQTANAPPEAKPAESKERDEKIEAEAKSKEWRETMEKYNRFVGEQSPVKALEVANEAAERFGHEDALVQSMLLNSTNAVRKSQGLAPIIPRTPVLADEETLVVMGHSLKDLLPANEADRGKFAEILTQCILASIASDASEEDRSHAAYDAVQPAIMVCATIKQQKLVHEILKRIGKKLTPPPQ